MTEVCRILISVELWPRLEQFSAAYNEVSLGEEFRKEFIMFSYDVPLSKRFVPNEIAAFAERGRRIMRTHPEFRDGPMNSSVGWNSGGEHSTLCHCKLRTNANLKR